MKKYLGINSQRLALVYPLYPESALNDPYYLTTFFVLTCPPRILVGEDERRNTTAVLQSEGAKSVIQLLFVVNL